MRKITQFLTKAQTTLRLFGHNISDFTVQFINPKTEDYYHPGFCVSVFPCCWYNVISFVGIG